MNYAALKTAKASFVVKNDKGLHTRPCTEIVRCAMTFSSEILFRIDNMICDAKSVLSLLTLSAGKGAKVEIEAQGKDAEDAVQALLHLAEQDFHMSF